MKFHEEKRIKMSEITTPTYISCLTMSLLSLPGFYCGQYSPVSGPIWNLGGGQSQPAGPDLHKPPCQPLPSSPGCCIPTGGVKVMLSEIHRCCCTVTRMHYDAKERVNTDLYAETLLLNVGQSDGPIVLPRLLHQETLLTLVFLHMLLCGRTHHRSLDLCKTTETHLAI